MCVANTIGKLNRQGMEFCNQKKYDESLVLLKQALQVCQDSEFKTYEVKILNNIGLVLQMQEEFNQADVFFDEALVKTQGLNKCGSYLADKIRKNKETALRQAA